uniref:Mitochondrial amidoxime reducing component 2 n=1 Tax=Scleropages formosus TaxID=113540 RepID=A0A8C9RVV6_SCLFO
MDVGGSLRSACLQHRRAALWAAGLALAAVAALGLAWSYFRKPRRVTRVGVVSQLVVHPLKSGKGLSVTSAECLTMGLKYGDLKDRHWLVITEDGHQVTGRQQPRLVFVSLNIDKGQVCLNAPGMEELLIPFRQPGNRIASCRVWGSDIQGRDCGDKASAWMTRYLACDQTFHLVQFEPQMKARKPAEKFSFFPQNEMIAYPDNGAIMLMTESSLMDLNTRLESKVTMSWFRPSIVVADSDSYAEDSWGEIQIGEVRLRRVMACSSYRMCDPSEKHIFGTSPLFGQYFTVVKSGILHVGDPVYGVTY